MVMFNPGQLQNMDNARFKRYKEMLSFYQGNQWQGKAHHNEKRLTFNYARVIVDKLTSYLMNGFSVRVVAPLVGTRKRRMKQMLHLNKYPWKTTLIYLIMRQR